jgi:hypothetical protein
MPLDVVNHSEEAAASAFQAISKLRCPRECERTILEAKVRSASANMEVRKNLGKWCKLALD